MRLVITEMAFCWRDYGAGDHGFDHEGKMDSIVEPFGFERFALKAAAAE